MEKIQINKLKKIIVCKDAGQTDNFIYVVKNKINFDAILEDPAKSLFKKN